MNKNLKGLTLIEIMLWVLITAIVLISWFEAYTKIWIWKIRLIENTNMQKDSFYFSEKLFQLVKEWGTVDYEEYFNRKVVWTTYWSGHYNESTWFWNFWRYSTFNNNNNVGTWNYGAWFYLCRSWVWIWNKLSDTWCYDNWLNSTWIDYSLWIPQRYGQYSFQYLDYNSNYDNDTAQCPWARPLWDENCDWNAVWDDDDEYLWEWPIVFNWGEDVKELYLLSWNKTERTLIRWNILEDSFKPSGVNCTITWWVVPTWDGCRWTIEFLKLEWKDWWLDHNDLVNDVDWTQYDWVVDTWLIDWKFSGLSNITQLSSVVAWSTVDNYWEPLFPDDINVTDFKVYLYPNVDFDKSWRNLNLSSSISPYTTINFKIKPSWKTRLMLKNDSRELSFSTTINLTDIYSK